MKIMKVTPNGGKKMINEFQGKYRFLSNFYMAEVVYEGITYPSSEHAFQAAKSLSETERKFISKLKTPGKAKRAGKKVNLRPNWELIKDQVMKDIVRDKFTRHKRLRTALLETGTTKLIEGNTWGDLYWGANLSTGVGRNQLGRILMQIRDELRNES